MLINAANALLRRTTCKAGDNSPECETPVRDNSLAIGLGVGIPLFFALTTLIFLHFRHVRKLKKEEENDKDIDLDNDDDFDPPIMNLHQKASAYTLNSNGEKVPAMSLNMIPDLESSLMNLDDPFNQTKYIHGLNSSQRSLNNVDPYDMSAYPPSGAIYESPKYPASVYTRSSSPASVTSNPYSSSHIETYNPYGPNPSQQALNPSSTSLHKNYPKMPTNQAPYMNSSRVSSTLSVVSSHTPTVQSFASHPPVPMPASATVGHSEHASVSSSHTTTNDTNDYLSDHQISDITIPDDDDDESRLNRIEQKLDNGIHELEAEAQADATKSLKAHSESQASHYRDMSQFSFNNEENFISTPASESSDNIEPSDLNRTVTKRTADFERVKSVYNEYYPSNMRSPEMGTESREFSSIGNAITSDDTPSQDQSYYQQNTQTTVAQPLEKQVEVQQVQPVPQPVQPTPSYVQPPQKTVEIPQQYQQPSQQNRQKFVQPPYQGLDLDNSADHYRSPQVKEMQSPTNAQYTTSPSYGNPERLPTPRSVASPKPASVKSVTSLPKLTTLPTPHKLDKMDDSMSYASQRRNNSPASSPAIPIYNPVTSPLSHDERPLPSPSQLGQSVAVFSSTDFVPPKKFAGSGGNRSRSSSLGEAAELGTFRTGSTTPRGGFRQRPPSELVPDVKSQLEKLKPQMNMNTR